MDIYGYFVITDNFETCPAWVQSENYFNCENFSKLFKFNNVSLYLKNRDYN